MTVDGAGHVGRSVTVVYICLPFSVSVTVDGAGHVCCSVTVVYICLPFSVSVTVTVDGAGHEVMGDAVVFMVGFAGMHLPPELKVILVHLGWFSTGVV